MPTEQNLAVQERRAKGVIVAAFLLIVFFVSQHINIYLWNSVHSTFFMAGLAALAALFLYFNGRSLRIEAKLLLAYWLWLFLSRLLNGGEVAIREYEIVMDFGASFLLGSVGLILNAEQRQRAIKLVGGFACGYYTLLAVISIVCSLLRITIVNPLTEKNICEMGVQGFARLSLLDVNPNITAAWFFASISTLLYFFLRCRKKLWRIPIVIAALLNYFAFTLTYCRNMKMGFSLCTAMLVILLALKYLKMKKLWQKVAVVILAAVIFLPLTYKSFAVPELILSKISYAIKSEQSAPTGLTVVWGENAVTMPVAAGSIEGLVSGEDGHAEGADATNDEFSDPRDFTKSLFTLSNRTQIFESAFATLKQEPMRLLRGCPSSMIMSIAIPMLKLHNVHFHNFLLQSLIYTGLVGFAAALIYCVLLVIRMVRFFFSEDCRAELPEKLLTLPLVGLLLYNMLEPMLFNYTDFSVLYFFFLAGIFLGYSYEIHPPKQRAKKPNR